MVTAACCASSAVRLRPFCLVQRAGDRLGEIRCSARSARTPGTLSPYCGGRPKASVAVPQHIRGRAQSAGRIAPGPQVVA
jgi:hypothetical protein